LHARNHNLIVILHHGATANVRSARTRLAGHSATRARGQRDARVWSSRQTAATESRSVASLTKAGIGRSAITGHVGTGAALGARLFARIVLVTSVGHVAYSLGTACDVAAICALRNRDELTLAYSLDFVTNARRLSNATSNRTHCRSVDDAIQS
jgi:hypothetical protein